MALYSWEEPRVPPPPPDSDRPPEHGLRIRYLDFGLSGTVAGFLWVTSALYAIAAVLWLFYWSVWSNWLDDGAVFADYRSVEDAEGPAVVALGIALLATLVTGILFLVWFNQAYKAGQSRGATGRRWGSGWAVGSWFIPLADLVIPKLVMNETDRMLNPWAGLPPIHDRWRSCPRLASSDLWWMLMVIGFVVSAMANSASEAVATVTDPEYGTALLTATVGYGINATAAALAGIMVIIMGKRGRQPLG